MRRVLPFVLVFAIALVPRLWLGLTYSLDDVMAKPGADATGYEILALNLLHGHGFTLDTEPPYRPDSIRTPLYPALIAAVYAVAGRTPRAVTLLQCVLDAATGVLVLLTARRLVSPGAGLAAGLIYALAPTQWRFAASLLTEAPLAFLIAAAVACLVWLRGAWRLGVTLGVLGALSVLCKPNVVPLPLLWAGAAACVVRPRWQAAVVTLGTAGVLLLPWVVRNQAVFGRPVISTAFEDNIAHVTAVATLASAKAQAVPLWSPPWEELYSSILANAEARYGFTFALERRWSPRETDRHWQQVGLVAQEIIRAHPWDAVKTQLAGGLQVWWGPAEKGWRTWWPYEYQGWYQRLTGREWPSFESTIYLIKAEVSARAAAGDWRGAALAFYRWLRLADWDSGRYLVLWTAFFVLGIVAFVAGVWALRRAPAPLLTMLAVIVYLTLLPGPIGYERFRVPFFPLVAIIQGAGVVAAATAVRSALRSG